MDLRRRRASRVDLTEPTRALHVGQDHACAITDAGALWCWGTNEAGQLGDAQPVEFRPRPVQVPGSGTWSDIRPGQHAYFGGPSYTCGIAVDGSTLCWGDNDSNRLGDGTQVDHLAPTPVAGDQTLGALRTGRLHAYATTNDGRGWCWGGDGYVLGTGLPDDGAPTPREIPGKRVQ